MIDRQTDRKSDLQGQELHSVKKLDDFFLKEILLWDATRLLFYTERANIILNDDQILDMYYKNVELIYHAWYQSDNDPSNICPTLISKINIYS